MSPRITEHSPTSTPLESISAIKSKSYPPKGFDIPDHLLVRCHAHDFGKRLAQQAGIEMPINPAADLAKALQSDGKYTLSDANNVWLNNQELDLCITLDASQLSVKITTPFNEKGFAGGVIQGSEWLVHGSVSVAQNDKGEIGILPSDYDFLPHGDFFGARWVRNLETLGGYAVGSQFFSQAGGMDYTILYQGLPKTFPDEKLKGIVPDDIFESMTQVPDNHPQ